MCHVENMDYIQTRLCLKTPFVTLKTITMLYPKNNGKIQIANIIKYYDFFQGKYKIKQEKNWWPREMCCYIPV